MRGLGTWCQAEGVPHACTADIVAGIMSWDQVNSVRSNRCPSLIGLEHRAEGVPQAAISPAQTLSMVRKYPVCGP